jgi:hypothetical protein
MGRNILGSQTISLAHQPVNMPADEEKDTAGRFAAQ